MVDLSEYTTTELEQELDRRKKPPVPEQLMINDFDMLREACEEYINFVASDDYHEDGESAYRHNIYEVALVAVYGSDIWTWLELRQK